MKKFLTILLTLACYALGFSQGNTPCTAVSLTVNVGICTPYTGGTTVGNTYSSNAANGGVPTCASPGAPDVWYSFVATNGSMIITTLAGSLTDMGMQIYSSSTNLCTGALTALNCDDDSGPGFMPELNLCGFTVGNTYWIRLWNYGGSGTGTFSICIYSSNTPNVIQNCSGATQVCSNSPFSGNSSGFGVQELNVCNRGCLFLENQSSWYILQIQTSGTLQMTISPNPGVDYDFAIWGPNPTCPPSTNPIRCSYASGATTFGQTGSYNTGIGPPGTETSDGTAGTLDGWVSTMNVIAGEIYVLLIDNFTANATPFNLNWGGTASLNCTPLPIELVSWNGQYENGKNMLRWETATETNCAKYVIERSVDGIAWTNVAEVQAHGNSSNVLRYSYADPNFQRGSYNYYRLTQYDFNGEHETFSIIVVDNSDYSKVKVTKRVDLLGREIVELSHYEGVYIEYLDDGTYRKMCCTPK